MTYYYDIWVSTKQFRNSSALTYSSTEKLHEGAIVLVPFRNKIVLGLVKSKSSKPKFKVRPISRLVHAKNLPKDTVSLFEWLINYYPSNASTHLQLFLPKSISSIQDSPLIYTSQKKTSQKKVAPRLTSEQLMAVKQIKNSPATSFLIHGNTGSGKTRVYIELIKETLANSKSVIVLIPEIGLSPQITKSLQDYFPNEVIIINSSLSDKTKRNNWEKILTSTSPIIVVGPRSAIFVPLNNLGLIIMDESHDSSYKQENAPFYQTTRVAGKLSEITNSKLVMGTASPLITDYYIFEKKKVPIIRMVKSALASADKTKSQIDIVDIGDKSLFAQSFWLSDRMIESIEESLAAKEQSLVFLNRRGTAASVMCQNCGWKALCPNCDISLTYHADDHLIICHSCGFKEKSPSSCPICHSHDIMFKGVGTKAIESELSKLFPSAVIKRFDRDNSKKDSLEMNYTDINNGKTDIIIGTQIVTKGLDLPQLTTVGIVMADQNLTFPDFSSDEKSYQTLLQVIGRVGRGHQSTSKIIIQTYNTQGTALLAALSKDYTSFYNNQLDSRKKYMFPPFVFMLKIYCKKNTARKAKESCLELIEQIKKLNFQIDISDPTPAFHEKVGGKYIWQFVVKSKKRQYLLDIISSLPNDWFYDIDPNNLL